MDASHSRLFGGYIAFFHTLKYVLYNFAVAASVGAFEAVRLTSSGHPGLAAVDLWLVLQINIALPVAILILIRALSNDVVHADCDPLTGLLNRRGFRHRALGLLIARPAGATWLVAAVIDMDCFKSLNDKYGHAAGDEHYYRWQQRCRPHATPPSSPAAVARSS